MADEVISQNTLGRSSNPVVDNLYGYNLHVNRKNRKMTLSLII